MLSDSRGLKALRKDHHISQERLARKVDCSTATIALVERGYRCSDAMARRIAAALECRPGGLVGASIAEEFRRFHTDNPHVYREVVRLAREWRTRRGSERVGIGMLFEVLRWHLTISTAGDPFRLNNNHRAFYARLVMQCEPDLADVFELRRSRADDAIERESGDEGLWSSDRGT